MKRNSASIPLHVYAIVVLLLFTVTFASNQAVTVLSQSMPVAPKHCIIIDAGHGGVDGGATSCTGVLESQLNLEIALRLNDLCHLLGLNTHMIRTTDTSVYTEGTTIAQKKISDLKERVRIVNGMDNAILVSIHQNYFSQSEYWGAQVFHCNNESSKAFAREMQTQLVSALNQGSNRKAKPASGVYLMEHIQRPGILIECGFLSNPKEEARLRSNEYQKQLCAVISTVCSQFLQQDGSLS